jgi:alpha-glucosidase
VGPTELRFTNVWFGQEATMIDWSVPEAGAWIHDHRRKPFMVDYGVRVHWTDLGEPEFFSDLARYAGHDLDGDGSLRTGQADLANVYNLFWHRSIDAGYARNDPDQRRILLTRAATAGIQRYGAAVWSGDTSSRMEVLVSQLHNQAHLSCSGIDYYGSDVGGFHRQVIRDPRLADELYTQWFANSAWFDVPLRPHVNNYDFYDQRVDDKPDGPGRHPVAPYEVGHRPSNLANLRTRYALIPYYYSLAHRASVEGIPIVPPPGIVHPDQALLGIAHQKLVGTDLMVAVVAAHGEYARRVYLPAGRWYDFWSGAVVDSGGDWITFVPEYRDGVLRLPVFARAGAVLPMMHVDAATLDSLGHRTDGTRAEDLVLRVYQGDAGGRFTVHEDDGETRSSPVRTTEVVQRREGDEIVVEVGAADGTVPGLADVRPLRIELVSPCSSPAVTVDGVPLPPLPAPGRDDAGWVADPDRRTVHACVPDAAVAQGRTFRFSSAGRDRSDVVRPPGLRPRRHDLGRGRVRTVRHAGADLRRAAERGPARPVRHVRVPLPAAAGHPSGPVWTLLLDHVQPNQQVRFTLEKRRGDAVVHVNPRELYRDVGPGGYVGEIRGNLY